jgi:transcriptional regulator with PAS, ATPase and Fis domain
MHRVTGNGDPPPLTSALDDDGPDPIIGASPAIRAVRARIAKLAATATTVLITGESGTGKEVVARQVHALSRRRDAAFVPINCGAIPEALLESQLFGHVRGAFTSAVAANRGLFAAADGGTLFLDEVGELPLVLQVKLLRALETREIWPVGGTAPSVVDVRVLAATNRDLAQDVESGRFRADLYYRLNVASITLPALRDRRRDIPLLVDHFIKRLNAKLGTTCVGVDDAAVAALMNASWRGNVRELENVIERALNVSDGSVVSLADLPSDVKSRGAAQAEARSLRDATREFEAQYIMDILRRTNFDKKEAARLLDISVSSLYRKLEGQPDEPESTPSA